MVPQGLPTSKVSFAAGMKRVFGIRLLQYRPESPQALTVFAHNSVAPISLLLIRIRPMKMQTFTHDTLCFEHPANWTVETREIRDDAGEREGISATVYAPEAGFWSVVRWDQPGPAEELIDAALKGLEEEYAELETESIQMQIHGCPAIGYRIQFWYLDLTNTAQLLCLSQPGRHDLIYWQLEDRDSAAYEGVFAAMTESLIVPIEEGND